jgi:hypothetical protein
LIVENYPFQQTVFNGSRCRVGFDGTNWNGKAGCYPVGEAPMVEKRGDFFVRDVVRRASDARSFGDYVNQERIFSICVVKRRGDSLTMRFGEKR